MTPEAIASRGFACPVAHTPGARPPTGAGVTVAINQSTEDDRRIAISIRHADGTWLTAYLSEALVDRYGHILAAAVEGDISAPIGGIRCVQ